MKYKWSSYFNGIVQILTVIVPLHQMHRGHLGLECSTKVEINSLMYFVI